MSEVQTAPAPPGNKPPPAGAPSQATRPSSAKRLLAALVLLLVLGALAFYGLHWWSTGRFLESTDDAYLRADNVTVAPRVSGYVAEVLVADNQAVEAGQPLLRIDPITYAATLARQQATRDARQADVAVAEARWQAELASVEQAQARLAGDTADARFAGSQVARYRGLAATGAETPEKLAQTVNQKDKADAVLKADAAAVLSAQRQAVTARAQVDQARAQVAAADEAVREANIDVGNTLIRAPAAGQVGDKTVRPGQFVQPGTRLLSVVPVKDTYVVANFKETQLHGIRPGDGATVSVDALDGRKLDATIVSLAPGTGAQFSLLPPENATGNFTKIVQRVPVRLRLDTDDATRARLVPGLSVTVTVDTKPARTGADAGRS